MDEKGEMREDVLDGKLRRWDVKVDEGTPEVKSEGYFGEFTIISVGGMKTLVFCDPRDALCVPMLADWYDDVSMTECGWDVDTRFRSEPNGNPLLVKRCGKWTMIGYEGGPTVTRNGRMLRKPYRDDWYDSIGKHENLRSVDKDGNTVPNLSRDVCYVERWYDAVKDGNPVRLNRKCQVIEENASVVMRQVAQWDKWRIARDWIGKDRPCYHIKGFRYKGKKPRRITMEEAEDRIKYHDFGMGFYSLDWSVEDGKVALVFESYSESDME